MDTRKFVNGCQREAFYYSEDDTGVMDIHLKYFWPETNGKREHKEKQKSSVISGDKAVQGYSKFLTGQSSQFLHHPTSIANMNDYCLRLKNVSYIRTFSTGNWYSKLFNPPVTAQFLKDVTFEIDAGEIMGVLGATGCGKTTLLNVIGRRVQGAMGGTVLFNNRTLTQRTFQNTCAYVSFKQHLIEQLTVRATLNYQAQLALGRSMNRNEIMKRIGQMLKDFELMEEAEKKIINLKEDSRRRVLIAMHAIKDPVMILIEDPSRGMDPLGSYQLMFLFSRYIRKYNRIGIVSMRIPRSDIYPLLDRLTVLCFGEVMYSGYTKLMPLYFRNVRFPCPSTENPAVYFISLATVDRETSKRYTETREQAIKLIELFKVDGDSWGRYTDMQKENNLTRPAGHFLPLCHLGKPSCVSKFFTLTRRNCIYLLSHWPILLARVLSIPLFSSILCLFYFGIKPTPTSPQTIAGLIFNTITSFSIITVATTAQSFQSLRTRYYQDSWDNLYSGGIFIISYLFSTFIPDLFAIFAGAGAITWACNLVHSITEYILFSLSLWSCAQFAHLHTLCIMLFIKSSYKASAIVISLLSVYLTASAGFLKSFTTFQQGGSEWLHYITYSSVYRYAGAYLQHQHLFNITTGCSLLDNIHQTGSSICRWESGKDYLHQVYNSNDLFHPIMNLTMCLCYVPALAALTVLLYTLPMPHCVKRKFRYK